jgi:hypothetical protein
MPIKVLFSEQPNATEVTENKAIKLLNYCNTHPETKICYHASDMILHIHSDASYFSESEAKSRAGGFFLHGKHHQKRQKTHKRGHFDLQQSTQTSNVISIRSITRCSLH